MMSRTAGTPHCTAPAKISLNRIGQRGRSGPARGIAPAPLGTPVVEVHGDHGGFVALPEQCAQVLNQVVRAVVGGGTRALPGQVRLNLALAEERRFGSGTAYLSYRPAQLDRKPNGFLLWVTWISCSGHWPTRPGGRCLMSCSPATVRRSCPSRRGTT